MEEKILIKSKVDTKIKVVSLILSLALLQLAVLLVSVLSLNSFAVRGYRDYYYIDGFSVIFGGHSDDCASYAFCMVLFILFCACFVVGTTLLIIYLVTSKCEIEITEKNVKGKSFFGKEVVLPLYMVSAYSTSKFLSTIAVATSSGITKFALIKNYAEIGNVLSQKINERQDDTASPSTASTPAPQSDGLGDLKKLKELLDAGIITQEEFDAKKKQILGL